jgi:CheY-like chemotaxis protein
MDTPLPWLIAGTAVGLALALAGRSVHRRVAATRRARRADETTGASTDGLESTGGSSVPPVAASAGTPRPKRKKDPARVAAKIQARAQADRVIAAEAERVRLSRAAKAARAAPHVLVVDDSNTVRQLTGSLLERNGYRVTYAVDGMEALLRIASELPDALVTDIEMPRLDGISLVRRLRADPRTAPLPIVMISSAEARFREAAHESGVDVLLAKLYADAALLAPLAPLKLRR